VHRTERKPLKGSIPAGAAESGNRGRDPWESRKADWAHLLVRLGQLTSCAGGEAREAPKPNERVLRPGNQDQLPRADAIVEAVSGRCGHPGPEVRQLILWARGRRREERKLPSMTCPG
jgi:hypothetical protein